VQRGEYNEENKTHLKLFFAPPVHRAGRPPLKGETLRQRTLCILLADRMAGYRDSGGY
jgi:hypothetical protein